MSNKFIIIKRLLLISIQLLKSATQLKFNSSNSAWLTLLKTHLINQFHLLKLPASSPPVGGDGGKPGLRKKRGAEAPRQTKTTHMRKFPFMKLLLLPADKQSRSALNLHHALPSSDRRLLKKLHRVYPHRCG